MTAASANAAVSHFTDCSTYSTFDAAVQWLAHAKGGGAYANELARPLKNALEGWGGYDKVGYYADALHKVADLKTSIRYAGINASEIPVDAKLGAQCITENWLPADVDNLKRVAANPSFPARDS
jgi:hypothetical protein